VLHLDRPTPDAPPTSLLTPTLFFWVSLAISRLTLSSWSWGEEIPGAKQKRLVYGALILAGVLLFLPALYSSVNSVDTLAAVACAGGVLGPVYPSVVAVVHHGMGERERLAGMGVVVAFGSAGAVAGLVVSQLFTRFSVMPVVLYLAVVAGLVGGMLLCCKGLLDEARSVEEKAVA
jgi:fucose permease